MWSLAREEKKLISWITTVNWLKNKRCKYKCFIINWKDIWNIVRNNTVIVKRNLKENEFSYRRLTWT